LIIKRPFSKIIFFSKIKSNGQYKYSAVDFSGNLLFITGVFFRYVFEKRAEEASEEINE